AGGRIAIYSDTTTFTGPVTAFGGSGWESGGAGTILAKSSAHTWGELRIDNHDTYGALTPLIDPYTFDEVVVAAQGRLGLTVPDGLTAGQLTVQDGGFVELQTTTTLGSVHIQSGGQLTHLAGQPGFHMTVLTDLVIHSGGLISANGKGYGSASGPGAGGSADTAGGGGYGGTGGSSTSGAPGGPTYGSMTQPVDLGSGGGRDTDHSRSGGAGGGAIRLDVAGMLLVDGNLTARGRNGTGNEAGGGSGGSIYLTVGALAGEGVISADGGAGADPNHAGGGGGGRIAIYYTDATAFDLANNVSVAGGPGCQPGKPGSIWLADPEAAPFISEPDTGPVGLLRTPVDHLDIAFTRPIDPATFTADDILLWGPEGEVLITDIDLVPKIGGHETYTVRFEPQEANGTFSYSIGPNITAVNGKLLDQDHDGTGGEPIEDVFEGRFTIDTIGPKINHHVPSGDNAGTVEYVDVWFSGAINVSTFTVADVSITGPSGPITPTGFGDDEVGINAFRILFAPQTEHGDYHVLVGPNVEDLAGNLMDQDGDGAQGKPYDPVHPDEDDVYDAWFNLVDVDLTLFDVSVIETEMWAGEPFHVSWSGKNASGYQLFGDWTDAVYFSADDQWDIDDVLLKTVEHTGGLAQDGSYHQEQTVNIPGALPGQYYLIVRADLYNQAKEGEDEGNNVVALGPYPLHVHGLATDGTPQGGTLSTEDRSDYYAVSTEMQGSLATLLSGLDLDADAEFFVSYETIPTRLAYDYCSTLNQQGDPATLIAGTVSGNYYVLAHGNSLGEDGSSSYEMRATAGELLLADLSPKRHGNASVCTMTITGAGFDTSTSVKFVAANGTEHTADDVQYVSPTTLVATLDLPNWGNHGDESPYDVVVEEADVVPSVLENIFQVVEGVVSQLETNLIVPSRVGFRIPIRQTIWIEYANTGDVSMPAPLLELHGSHSARITADVDLAVPVGGFGEVPGVTDMVQVLGIGASATPGVLQPGESGRIPIYYIGLAAPTSYPRVTFTLGTLTADDTTLIDWPAIKDDLRPEWMPADGWDAIVANLAESGFVGDTWGDYVAMLDDNMNYLSTVCQKVTDIEPLWNFEITQAAALRPYPYLRREVDS
ncbi:MAG: hypothetical protein ACYSWU_15290, partial [Planctomycetota bacterium]